MTVRALTDAHYADAARIAGEAFGVIDDVERWSKTLVHSHCLGAFDGERLVSFARVKPYEQWFGGRAVPMGGIASVAVAGSHQRRGIARETVAETLPWMRENGYAISTLFPATTPLYRSLGWEHAGDYTWLDVAAASLRDLGPATGVRPATEADVPGILDVYEAICADSNGLLQRSGPFFDLSPATVLGADSVLVAEGDDGIEGFARADRKNRGHHVDVEAWDVHATTPSAARSLWFALGAGSSTVDTVRAKAYADDVLPLLGEPAVTVHDHQRWMLRLVDPPAAVAARGWPASLRASVDLDVVDDGRWRLTVEDGNGTLARGGDGTVALDIGALSAVWTGYADPRTWRRLGRISCADDGALDTLATMTAGPRPRLLDYF